MNQTQTSSLTRTDSDSDFLGLSFWADSSLAGGRRFRVGFTISFSRNLKMINSDEINHCAPAFGTCEIIISKTIIILCTFVLQ